LWRDLFFEIHFVTLLLTLLLVMLFNLVVLSLIYFKFVPKHLRLTYNCMFSMLVFKFITTLYILFIWSDLRLTPVYLCVSLHVLEIPALMMMMFSVGYLKFRVNISPYKFPSVLESSFLTLILSTLLQIPLILFVHGYGYTYLVLYVLTHVVYVAALLSCKLNYLEGDERFLFIFIKYTVALYTQLTVILNLLEFTFNPSPTLLNLYVMLNVVVYFLIFNAVFAIFHRNVTEKKSKYSSRYQRSL
jgi:hypothetical protein